MGEKVKRKVVSPLRCLMVRDMTSLDRIPFGNSKFSLQCVMNSSREGEFSSHGMDQTKNFGSSVQRLN